MRGDDLQGLGKIGVRFSELVDALSNGPEGPRSAEEYLMLADSVRDALDRRRGSIGGDAPVFVADTFSRESVVHRGERHEIWQLRHRDLATMHAIKTLSDGCRDDPVARELLLREGRIGIRLQHPGLVSARTVLRLADGRPGLLMDWKGESLAHVAKSGLLSTPDILAAVSAALAVLAYLHDRDVVHCDVAPGNLLRSEDEPGRWMLADFGIALERGESHASLDIRRAGTPEFVAPEQRAGEPVRPASDIYAVGRLMQYLLAHCAGKQAMAERLQSVAAEFCREAPHERPGDARAAAAIFTEATGRR